MRTKCDWCRESIEHGSNRYRIEVMSSRKPDPVAEFRDDDVCVRCAREVSMTRSRIRIKRRLRVYPDGRE